ncbi:MAG TPA: hypothetical protein VJT73_02955 [Polyangiaceae bacterium]|nr:hypothetical protein [Polyangiaceae bacterium]
MSRWAPVAAALRQLAEAVASLDGGAPADHIDQTTSALGPRRHCRAVKRRIASGQSGAAIVGRRHLLSPEALAEELTRVGQTPEASVVDELRASLRLIDGGR